MSRSRRQPKAELQPSDQLLHQVAQAVLDECCQVPCSPQEVGVVWGWLVSCSEAAGPGYAGVIGAVMAAAFPADTRHGILRHAQQPRRRTVGVAELQLALKAAKLNVPQVK